MKRLTLKLEKLTASTGINIDEELGNDMQAIVNNHQPDINAMKNDDFRRIFWEQQVHHTYMYIIQLFMCACILSYVHYYMYNTLESWPVYLHNTVLMSLLWLHLSSTTVDFT